jgi:hypothetical protein
VPETGGPAPFEASIRRRDDAHLDVPGETFTHTPHFSFLQNSQQFRLCPRRELTDLIQKKRATVGLFEETSTFRNRASKCPTGVTEELRLCQILGECRTVECGKISEPPWTLPVNSPRDQFFAYSTLSNDQHRKRRDGCANDAAPEVRDRLAATEQLRTRIGNRGRPPMVEGRPAKRAAHCRSRSDEGASVLCGRRARCRPSAAKASNRCAATPDGRRHLDTRAGSQGSEKYAGPYRSSHGNTSAGSGGGYRTLEILCGVKSHRQRTKTISKECRNFNEKRVFVLVLVSQLEQVHDIVQRLGKPMTRIHSSKQGGGTAQTRKLLGLFTERLCDGAIGQRAREDETSLGTEEWRNLS